VLDGYDSKFQGPEDTITSRKREKAGKRAVGAGEREQDRGMAGRWDLEPGGDADDGRNLLSGIRTEMDSRDEPSTGERETRFWKFERGLRAIGIGPCCRCLLPLNLPSLLSVFLQIHSPQILSPLSIQVMYSSRLSRRPAHLVSLPADCSLLSPIVDLLPSPPLPLLQIIRTSACVMSMRPLPSSCAAAAPADAFGPQNVTSLLLRLQSFVDHVLPSYGIFVRKLDVSTRFAPPRQSRRPRPCPARAPMPLFASSRLSPLERLVSTSPVVSHPTFILPFAISQST